MPSSAAKRMARTAAVRVESRVVERHADPLNPARRKRCRLDLVHFLRTYLPARFPLDFSPDHLRVIAGIQSSILTGGLAAYAMPRGSGKTTITEGAAIWATLYEHRKFIFLIGSDAEAASQSLESIKSELEHNDLLHEDFAEATQYIRALDGIPQRAGSQMVRATDDAEPTRTLMLWTGKSIRLAQVGKQGGGCVVRTAGITGRIRGAKASLADGTQVRPDLVLIDDPQTDESAASPSQVAKRINVITSTIIGLAGPGKNIAAFCPCTVIQKNDVADQLLDRAHHPEWHGIKIRMMLSMPRNLKLWDQYAEIRRASQKADEGNANCNAFYKENRAELDDGAIHYWPERVIEGDLSAIQSAMNWKIDKGENGEAAFAAEMQNEPLDPTAAGDIEQLSAPAIMRKVNQHERGIIPVEDTIVTAGIDVQGPALYWAIVAWSPTFGGDVIAYGCYPDQGRSYFSVREIEKTMAKEHPGGSWEASLYASLDALCKSIIGTVWNRDDGTIANVEQVLIDAGYGESTDTIYQFCRRSDWRATVLPYFGRAVQSGQSSMDEWKKKPGDRIGQAWRIPKPGARQTRHVLADANRWKSFVADRLLTKPGDAGCLSLYGSDPSAHRMLAAHLAAEYRVRVVANGRATDEWRTKPNQDNHWLDCISMAAIAASIRGSKLDVKHAGEIRANSSIEIAPRDMSPATDADPVPVPPRVVPRPNIPRSGGFLSGLGFSGGF